MAGFNRRYNSPQALSVITAIEGVITIDNPVPGPIAGASTGVACCVGEFADCSSSLKSDGAGGLTTNYTPRQVFGTAQGQQSFGGFDPTIGDFGITGGNGWVDAFVSKQWAALVLVAINIASSKATRLVRALPTNTAANNPTPIVPMQAASVAASTQFQDGSANPVRVAGAQTFTGTNAYGSGTDGAIAITANSPTQTFTAASLAALISAKAITVGDILVMGVVEAAQCVINGTIGGTAASGTLTISGGSGNVGGTIGGTLVTIAQGILTDDAAALALIAAINTNATTSLLVNASHGSNGVVLLTSRLGGTLGNATTLVASGTGVVASNTTLLSGADGTALTVNSVISGNIVIGQVLSGSGITNGTTVISGSGTSWVVSAAQSAGPETINFWDTYGAPGVMGGYGGTFRVEAVGGSNTLTLEQLDGTSWATQLATALPWRLHNAATADTAAQGQALNPGATYAAAVGYTVPARPIKTTIAAGTVMDLTTPAAAPTATSWNPLSGLAMLVQPTGLFSGGLVYTAAIQAPNAAYSSTLAAQYVLALASTLAASSPSDIINIIWCARTDSNAANTIRSALMQNVETASATSAGRTAVISPPLNTVTTLAAISTSAPGVGATRDERVDYTWPGANVYVQPAVNTPIATAVAGLNTTDGNLDVRMDAFLASILSVLSPNRNPGQGTPPAAGSGGVLSALNGYQRGAPALTINDYITMRANGIAGLYINSVSGPEIMSGGTSSLQSGQTTIMRRRMADFIEDSLSNALLQFAKQPATQALLDTEEQEADTFLNGLLSPNDPSQQWIAGYDVNANQGQTNTAAAVAQGVFVIQVSVALIPTQDFLVLNADIGTNVVINLSVGNGGVTSAQVA